MRSCKPPIESLLFTKLNLQHQSWICLPCLCQLSSIFVKTEMTTTTEAVLPYLGDQPYIRLYTLIMAVYALGQRMGSAFLPGGIHSLGVTMCERDWNVAHPPVIVPPPPAAEGEDGDADTIPDAYANVPRPEIPTKPVIFAAGADAATIALFKYHSDVYVAVDTAIQRMKEYVLAALGPMVTMALEDSVDDFASMSLLDIMQMLDDTYGTLRETDIHTLVAGLFEIIPADAEVLAACVRMNRTFRILERAGQPKSEQDKIGFLEHDTALLMGTQRCIMMYKERRPALHQRSFEGLVAHLRVHLPAQTVAAAGMQGGGTAHAATGPHPVLHIQPPQQVAHAVVYQPQQAHGAGRGGRGRGGRGGGGRLPPGRGGGRGAPLGPPGYCFWHGTGHSGITCRFMAVPENGFTDAMRRATGPCTLDGYEGHQA